jgi:glycosyltransferase involved in cell wall biosynthesis
MSSSGSNTFSVLFCVNRSNPHLRAAIDSVLGQTHGDFEFLIGANACDDAFFDELKSIANDRRVRILRTRMPQLAFTLNYLAEQATGNWLIRMDADDVCEPHRFARLLQVIDSGEHDVIGSWATLIDRHDRVIGQFSPPKDPRRIRRRLLFSNPIAHPTVAFSRDFLLRMRGYLGGYVSEDFDLWIRALRSGARITNIEEPLLRYRVHDGQVSRSRLGYAEAAAHWHRELLLAPSLYNALGWLIANAKAVVMPMRNRLKKKTIS